MIKRIWHGWATPEHADAYEQLLVNEIVPGIADRRILGYLGTEIWRECDPAGPEVCFATVMTFDDWDAVRQFAGGDGRNSVVPSRAQALLDHFDTTSTHYELVASTSRSSP